MVVLGLDPGARVTGYACLDVAPDGWGTPIVREAGVFRLSTRKSISERLVELEKDLEALLDRARPGVVCVESLFSHVSHPGPALVMAHARGVLLCTLSRGRVPLLEVAPASVKKAVTGSGRATKQQMQSAVATILGLGSLPEPADVADALALAICGARRHASAADAGDRVVTRRVGRVRVG